MSLIQEIYKFHRACWHDETMFMSNPYAIMDSENARFIIDNKDLFLEFILEELKVPTTLVFLMYKMYPNAMILAEEGNIEDMCNKWREYLNSN